MSCPKCENRDREYLVFRKAVAKFAKLLDQLEVERRRVANENRPHGVLPMPDPEPIELENIDHL